MRSFVPTVALIYSSLTNAQSATRTFRPQPDFARGADSRLRQRPIRKSVLTAGSRISLTPITATAAAKNWTEFIRAGGKMAAGVGGFSLTDLRSMMPPIGSMAALWRFAGRLCGSPARLREALRFERGEGNAAQGEP